MTSDETTLSLLAFIPTARDTGKRKREQYT
jgi:hypothetical protein